MRRRGIVMETSTVRGTNTTHIEWPNAMDSAAEEAPSNAVCHVRAKAGAAFGSTVLTLIGSQTATHYHKIWTPLYCSLLSTQLNSGWERQATPAP